MHYALCVSLRPHVAVLLRLLREDSNSPPSAQVLFPRL
jgi:hypothetical protein